MKLNDWKDYAYRCHYLKAWYLYLALVPNLFSISIYCSLSIPQPHCHILSSYP